MNTLVKHLLLGGSATALIAGAAFTAAYAQAGDDITTVEVSASRINMAGFQSPTPVQVIGIEQIERNAQLNIGDEIRDLPQVGGTATRGASTANIAQGNAGIDSLSLRGFGAVRNLVLFDHQRVVASAIQDGVVDLQTIPSALVQRVDVVTGGASAAWGSDAVTGVINLVINKNFEGFKGNVEYANNVNVPLPRYHADLAWGTSFADGRGHFEIAGTWNISNTPNFAGQDPKRNGRTNVYNPAYCAGVTYAPGVTTGGICTSTTGAPFLMYIFNAGVNDRTQGGLINQNTAGNAGSALAANGLKGIMFVGQDASPTPFNYGTTYNGTTCYNGCSNNQYSNQNTTFGLSSIPFHSANYFSYTSYQLTPDIKASVQLAHGRFSERNRGTLLSASNQTFYADNPYLDPSIAQRFVCNPNAPIGVVSCAAGTSTLSNGYNPFTQTGNTALTSAASATAPTQRLVLGIDFANNRQAYNPSNNLGNVLPAQSANAGVWTMANVCSAIGDSCNYMSRVFNRASLSLDGVLSDAWTWSSYLSWSQMRMSQKVTNDVLRPRLANALDAVRVTSANQGTSNLAIGSIQCRGLLTPSNLTTPTIAMDLVGCQPVNVFGYGNVSNEAMRFISPGIDWRGTGILDHELVKMGQVAAGMSINGVLPWQLPAGEIGVAFGAEYRLEQAGQFEADPHGFTNQWNSGNWTNFEAQYHVEEGFLEVALPILKDTIVQSLDIDLAGRYTSYSASGPVETWKIGINSQVTDDVRIRGFYSYDIRAPTVYDLYNAGGANSQQCNSWVTGGGTNVCSNLTSGNPNLQPEKANTVAVGIVLTPSFIDGLTASLDWYDLRLHGGVTTIGFADEITRAKNGELQYCPLLITSDGSNICSYSQAAGTTGVPTITGVKTAPLNLASQTTAGFDTSIDYRFDLGSGQASVGFSGNYVYDWSRTLNGIYFQGAGSTGGYFSQGSGNFSGQFNLSYRTGPWTFASQIHLSGDAERDYGTENNPALVSVLSTVRYTRVNGVDVVSVGSGQGGAGYLPSNYVPWTGDIGGRVQYRWSENITLYGAIDRLVGNSGAGFPNNQKSYRAGIRFNL